MTLAWHTNFASRWLDPQQHDGTATPDNFINAIHDALIKSFRDQKFGHRALAEDFDFPEDALSATFQLRQNVKFHDGSPVTAKDVKWSYENYGGASAKLLHEKTRNVTPIDDRTIRFEFITPFLDFPIILGTANICGAGWVVPADYYQKIGKEGFLQKPIGAGPYKVVSQEPGSRIVMEAFEHYYRPVHIKRFEIISVPDSATRLAMLSGRKPISCTRSLESCYRVPDGIRKSCWRRSSRPRGGSSFRAFKIQKTRSATSACARPSASR